MPTRVSIAEVTTRIDPVSVSTETSLRSGGWLRTTANTSTANSTPSPATLPNAIDQVVACSSAASGMIATSDRAGPGCRSSAPSPAPAVRGTTSR